MVLDKTVSKTSWDCRCLRLYSSARVSLERGWAATLGGLGKAGLWGTGDSGDQGTGSKKTTMTKIQLSLTTLGIVVGIDGILHGISEVLQGSDLVETNIFRSLPANWPNAAFYQQMDGMPAFSIVTGIPFALLGSLAILASSLLILHIRYRMERPRGILTFALLILFGGLFGAGFGTPLTLGLPLVVFGLLSKRFNQKKARTASATRRLLTTFRVAFALQIFSWILFWVILVGLSFADLTPTSLYVLDVFLMLFTTPVYLIAGLMYDNTQLAKNADQ